MAKKPLQRFIFLVVFLYSFGGLYAQGFIEGRLTVGAKGSFSYSTISQPDQGWSNLLSGGSTGIYIDFKALDQLGVTVEGLFNFRKGAGDVDLTLVYNPQNPYIDERMTSADFWFQTIEVPILANFYLNTGSGIEFKAFAGPSFDFFLKGQSVRHMEFTETDGTLHKYSDENDITERINYWDIGAVAGIGVGMDISFINVTFDLRYRMGLKGINNVADSPDFYGRNFMATIGVGYAF